MKNLIKEKTTGPSPVKSFTIKIMGLQITISICGSHPHKLAHKWYLFFSPFSLYIKENEKLTTHNYIFHSPKRKLFIFLLTQLSIFFLLIQLTTSRTLLHTQLSILLSLHPILFLYTHKTLDNSHPFKFKRMAIYL